MLDKRIEEQLMSATRHLIAAKECINNTVRYIDEELEIELETECLINTSNVITDATNTLVNYTGR